MHLGNGAVTPMCAVYGAAVATTGLGIGWALAKKLERPEPWKFALGTAMVFAAQTFNVTVLPQASGHLIGGFLLAHWFGPLFGAFGMLLVLLTQGLAFADGGLLTLGLNVLNMAVVPCLVAYPLWKRYFGRSEGTTKWLSLAGGAWASTVMAAAVCAIELLSVPAARSQGAAVIGMMLGVHSLIGLIEAGATVGAIALARLASDWTVATAALASAAAVGVVAVAASVGASPWPDGLEYTFGKLSLPELGGLAERAADLQRSLAVAGDYNLAATLAGCAALGLAAWAMGRLTRRAA